MRSLLLIICLTLLNASVFAQQNSALQENKTTESDSIQVYNYVEVMPAFKTDEYPNFESYLAKHIKYPLDAKMKKKEGRVYVSFIIEKDGSVSNVKIIEGKNLYPSCDAEAIRVISNSPKWTPGYQNGEIRRVRKVSIILFRL